MAGGTKKAGTGPRRKPSPPARRARRPALGNDPFVRGAALRGGLPTAAAPPVERAAAPRSTEPPVSAGPPAPFVPPARAEAPEVPARDEVRERAAAVERKLEGALEALEGRLQQLAERSGLGGGDLRDALGRALPALAERLSAAKDFLRLIEPSEGLDPFGMDPRLVDRVQPVVDFLYSTWWRVEVRGASHLPAAGGAIVVANHAGLVPWDALVLRNAARREAHRELRPLLDDRECDLPLVGRAAVRLGAVRASPDAALRLLHAGDLVGVFPEGSTGARKPWRERYRIQRFGRGGFVKIALRGGVPIVPCAVVGSEEAAPALSRPGWLADRLGIPALSASPLLGLGPVALVPLPSKWTLRFGEPIDLAAHGAAAAEDGGLVLETAERVRAAIQQMLDEDVAGRASVFL
ncbi:MAG TPA: 1-acyl-sn-glycerol-3-phosphate acyltransferase [Anaeromyxobacteraceae bacterium]|nr:1-acyl-sn-glycerol-3-phosphate acyltransferase [Anaeromyxobacteraceae bacterium]